MRPTSLNLLFPSGRKTSVSPSSRVEPAHVPDDDTVRDEHRDSAGGGLRSEQDARCADLTSPRRVVVGGDRVQKRGADGRAAERKPCRLARAAEPAREDSSDPELQSPNALPDQRSLRGGPVPRGCVACGSRSDRPDPGPASTGRSSRAGRRGRHRRAVAGRRAPSSRPARARAPAQRPSRRRPACESVAKARCRTARASPDP